MRRLSREILHIWRRTISLSWPVSVEETSKTLMLTTDIIIMGTISPIAVAAIGIADIYTLIPNRVGAGFGTGAIALSSQDTGRGADATRDEVVSQALLIGFIAGLPLALIGILLGQSMMAILGATSAVVRMGGIYLGLIFLASPVRIVALVGWRALQGTGETRLPMLVHVASNGLNIIGSIVLGLGFGIVPSYGIVGVGLATVGARVFEMTMCLAILVSDRSQISLTWSTDRTITRQLISISSLNIAEGLSASIADFPFTAMLLTFSTEVVAAFYIGRRVHQQLTSPIYRALGIGATIIVGQTLGEGNPAAARFNGLAIAALGFVSMIAMSGALIFWAEPVVQLFTADPATASLAVTFTQVFSIAVVFLGLFFPFAGALRSAGDTRTPFYARATGTIVVMLGSAYLLVFVWDYGLVGIYVSLILARFWRTLVVTVGFLFGDWTTLAAVMMAERAESTEVKP